MPLGACGSCWAHSGVESIESSAFINNNATSPIAPLLRLSVQEMVSCTCNGCAGGDFQDTNTSPALHLPSPDADFQDMFNYAQKSGLMGEFFDPYTAATGEP